MDDEGARHGIADFGRDLVADAAPLVERDVVFRAPRAGADVKLPSFGEVAGTIWSMKMA
jgi:hypothetical protein